MDADKLILVKYHAIRKFYGAKPACSERGFDFFVPHQYICVPDIDCFDTPVWHDQIRAVFDRYESLRDSLRA